MSIIAAFVSGEGAVVASDGRMFTPAQLDGEKVIKPAEIERDDFDKTFNFNNSIIGAFCGLLSFSGLTTSTHITEILSAIGEPTGTFESIIPTLGDNFRKRLNSISPDEILFNLRKVDILLVRRISKKAMGVVQMRFVPNNGEIRIDKNLSTIKNVKRYFLFGDDMAQNCASKVFTNNKAKNQNINFLSMLITKAIQTGISSAGKSPFNQKIASCGGTIFRKQII